MRKRMLYSWKNNQMLLLTISFLLIGISSNVFSCESYHSYVGTGEDSFFKVLDLEQEVTYNFSVIIEEWYQMDVGFSIHLSERPTKRNALVTADAPGTGTETILFTPTDSSDFYIRVYSNYDWGFIDVLVNEHLNGTAKIVEPYYPPFNWRPIWITSVIIGGVIVLLFFVAITMSVIKNVRWQNITLPKIRWPEIHWPKIRWLKTTFSWDSWKSWRENSIARRQQRRTSRRNKKAKGKKRTTITKGFQQKLTPTKEVVIIRRSNNEQKCMVSGLPVDPENEEAVVCPYCENIAKKVMLAEWLKVKGICPVCKESLLIEKCPKALAQRIQK